MLYLVARLRADAALRFVGARIARRGGEDESADALRRRHAVRQIGADDAVVAAGKLGIYGQAADIVAGTETVLHAADVEEAILVRIGIARGQVVAGSLIERRERAEHPAAKTACHLRAEDRIDDAACMDSRLKAVVVALAGEREDASALHEERTLLGKEGREALVDLDLERVALDLAEIRIDRWHRA